MCVHIVTKPVAVPGQGANSTRRGLIASYHVIKRRFVRSAAAMVGRLKTAEQSVKSPLELTQALTRETQAPKLEVLNAPVVVDGAVLIEPYLHGSGGRSERPATASRCN